MEKNFYESVDCMSWDTSQKLTENRINVGSKELMTQTGKPKILATSGRTFQEMTSCNYRPSCCLQLQLTNNIIFHTKNASIARK